MQKDDKGNSIKDTAGALGTTLIGAIVFLSIFGFLIYCMDTCMGKVL